MGDRPEVDETRCVFTRWLMKHSVTITKTWTACEKCLSELDTDDLCGASMWKLHVHLESVLQTTLCVSVMKYDEYSRQIWKFVVTCRVLGLSAVEMSVFSRRII